MAAKRSTATADDLDDVLTDDEPTRERVDAAVVEAIVQEVLSGDTKWVRGSAMRLGNQVDWQPQIMTKNRKAIGHFHFADVMRSYVVRRLKAAYADDKEVHVFLPIEALYDEDTLLVMAEIEAIVHVHDSNAFIPGLAHLDAFSSLAVPVSPKLRTEIAQLAWSRKKKGTSQEKGKRLESLLAFLFELVDDFHVVERNFNGDTDEIDIVLKVDRYSDRCWQHTGVPFVLVEAKNWQQKVGQPPVSLLIRRLQTKRGSARIALLLCTSGFTQDAMLEVVKTAESNHVVTLIPPRQLEEWIAAEDSDQFLEDAVRKAMLR
jgi:hypothetical protein